MFSSESSLPLNRASIRFLITPDTYGHIVNAYTNTIIGDTARYHLLKSGLVVNNEDYIRGYYLGAYLVVQYWLFEYTIKDFSSDFVMGFKRAISFFPEDSYRYLNYVYEDFKNHS